MDARPPTAAPPPATDAGYIPNDHPRYQGQWWRSSAPQQQQQQQHQRSILSSVLDGSATEAVPYYFDDIALGAVSPVPLLTTPEEPTILRDIAARLARIEFHLAQLFDAPEDVTKHVRVASSKKTRSATEAQTAKIACTNCRRCHEACSHDTPCKRCSDKGLTCIYRSRLPWASHTAFMQEDEEVRGRVERRKRDGVAKERTRQKKRIRHQKRKFAAAAERDTSDSDSDSDNDA